MRGNSYFQLNYIKQTCYFQLHERKFIFPTQSSQGNLLFSTSREEIHISNSIISSKLAIFNFMREEIHISNSIISSKRAIFNFMRGNSYFQLNHLKQTCYFQLHERKFIFPTQLFQANLLFSTS